MQPNAFKKPKKPFKAIDNFSLLCEKTEKVNSFVINTYIKIKIENQVCVKIPASSLKFQLADLLRKEYMKNSQVGKEDLNNFKK